MDIILQEGELVEKVVVFKMEITTQHSIIENKTQIVAPVIIFKIPTKSQEYKTAVILESNVTGYYD